MFQFFVPMNLREREHFVFRPFLKAQPSRENPLYETFMLLFVVIAENSRKIARAKKKRRKCRHSFPEWSFGYFRVGCRILAVIGRFDSVQKT